MSNKNIYHSNGTSRKAYLAFVLCLLEVTLLMWVTVIPFSSAARLTAVVNKIQIVLSNSDLHAYGVAISMIDPPLTPHLLLPRITIIANNYQDIPPRFGQARHRAWQRLLRAVELLVMYKWLKGTSGKITAATRLFWNTCPKSKINSRLWMYTPNGTAWYLFCLVWSSISYFRDEFVRSNQYVQVVKSQPHLDCFWNTYSKMKTNIRSVFHQIMNVYTKWNCLIPILSCVVKY